MSGTSPSNLPGQRSPTRLVIAIAVYVAIVLFVADWIVRSFVSSSNPTVVVRVPGVTTPPAANSTPAPQPGSAVDLLELVRLPFDALQGNWSRQDTGFKSDDDGQPGDKLRIRYHPTGPYDCSVVLCRLSGNSGMDIVLDFQGHPIDCKFGVVNKECWLQSPATARYRQNNPLFLTGRNYTVLMKVRDSSVSVFIDGRPIMSATMQACIAARFWTGDNMGPGLLGFRTLTPFQIRSAQVVPLQTEPGL